eukprot:m.87505 g.87505  ORF g.87505 m.87505 type:complete len:317 (+) comp8463_c0_seq3:70-1020(+)
MPPGVVSWRDSIVTHQVAECVGERIVETFASVDKTLVAFVIVWVDSTSNQRLMRFRFLRLSTNVLLPSDDHIFPAPSSDDIIRDNLFAEWTVDGASGSRSLLFWLVDSVPTSMRVAGAITVALHDAIGYSMVDESFLRDRAAPAIRSNVFGTRLALVRTTANVLTVFELCSDGSLEPCEANKPAIYHITAGTNARVSCFVSRDLFSYHRDGSKSSRVQHSSRHRRIVRTRKVAKSTSSPSGEATRRARSGFSSPQDKLLLFSRRGQICCATTVPHRPEEHRSRRDQFAVSKMCPVTDYRQCLRFMRRLWHLRKIQR